MQVVGEAADGAEAIEQFNRLRPDIVVMDIAMPTMDGLESTKQIISACPDARILALSRHEEEHYAIRTLRAGCLGYITKGARTHELHEAIRIVAEGRQFLSGRGKDVVAMQLLSKRPCDPPIDSLSDREFQVLCFIAQGQRVSEIATALGLGTKTIETYRANIRRKLGLRNDIEICRFAIENGLVEDTPPTRRT
jgi:two-component system invasion response regulator UvrY